MTNKDELKKFFDQLDSRKIGSASEMEKWLWDESEFASALSEEQAFRYIRMSCQTDDPEREKAYLFFVENVEPQIKLGFAELDKKYVDSPARKSLERDKYPVLDRKRENSIALFRKENVELEKEEAKLWQRYEKIVGGMTVMYDGQERTMQQLGRYQEEPARKVREETWLLGEKRRRKDHQEIDEIYDDLIELRQKIAKNAGFSNYRDYIFPRRERFDYTPEDCFRYHKAVERYIVPLIRELDEQRGENLELDELRPWDLAVDPEGKPPLRPFEAAPELVKGCVQIFEKVNPRFAGYLKRMQELNLLDLESRKGKAPGGYSQEMAEVQLPFIFMNAVGRDGDVWTLLHEAGHSFHSFLTREMNLLYYYRSDNVPIEFAEVASQTMEIIGGEHFNGTFYNKEEAARSRRLHLSSIIKLLGWIATIDSFQHWVYTNPGHSHDDRREAWFKLQSKFGGSENWTQLEDYRSTFWQRQLHLFGYPFYYIEYGIAFLGALGLWTRYRKDQKGAITAYERAMSLGGSKPLPDLFRAADLPFDFGPDTVRPYANELHSVIKAS